MFDLISGIYCAFIINVILTVRLAIYRIEIKKKRAKSLNQNYKSDLDSENCTTALHIDRIGIVIGVNVMRCNLFTQALELIYGWRGYRLGDGARRAAMEVSNIAFFRPSSR